MGRLVSYRAARGRAAFDLRVFGDGLATVELLQDGDVTQFDVPETNFGGPLSGILVSIRPCLGARVGCRRLWSKRHTVCGTWVLHV